MREKSVLVFGASGFVGGAVTNALQAHGHRVTALRAPRLPSMPASEAGAFIATDSLVDGLAKSMTGFDAVINAAGDPDASSRDTEALTAANAVLPGVLAAATGRISVPPRFIHVSSAVVQGRNPVLDSSENTENFSAYSGSKILGEQLVAQYGAETAVVYRPPSVHAPDRRVTRITSKIAGSPLATVAAPPSAPSPQALLPNVADAIMFLATCDAQPPRIVIHPSEGLTTASVMELLGGRKPKVMPRPMALALIGALRQAGRLMPALAANARRAEMLWLGQKQATSWLEDVGWKAPAGLPEWQRLGAELRGGTTGNRKDKGSTK